MTDRTPTPTHAHDDPTPPVDYAGVVTQLQKLGIQAELTDGGEMTSVWVKDAAGLEWLFGTAGTGGWGFDHYYDGDYLNYSESWDTPAGADPEDVALIIQARLLSAPARLPWAYELHPGVWRAHAVIEEIPGFNTIRQEPGGVILFMAPHTCTCHACESNFNSNFPDETICPDCRADTQREDHPTLFDEDELVPSIDERLTAIERRLTELENAR